MTLAHVLWFVAGLFIGTTFGVLLKGALSARGPCAQDALWHLGRLYQRMVGPLDAVILTPPGGIIDNARRFLQRWGEGEGS